MSLCLWLPLNGNLNNQGLMSPSFYRRSNLAYNNNGKIGKCLQFKGDNSQILSISNVPQKTDNFSWCCWACQTSTTTTNVGSTSTSQFLLSAGRDCGVIGFNIRIDTGRLCVFMGSGANTSTASTTDSATRSSTDIIQLTLNQWYHICITVDESNVHAYINGVLVKTFPLVKINYATDNVAYHSYFTIGKMAYNHTSTDRHFPFVGYINDVRIYDHCLSAKEVKEISKGLILHYPLSGPYEEPVKNLYSNKFENGYTNCNSEITRSILTDENGISYTNYKFSKSPGTTNTWYRIWYDRYPFQAGKTYTISMDIRVNSCSNCVVDLRHARLDNDYFGCKIARIVDSSNVTKDWKHYTLTQVIPASFVYNSETKTCNPLIELYTGNLAVPEGDSTTVRSADFDIKNVQVIENDHDLPFAPGSREDGIFDCSGYGNDGVVDYATCPTWNSDSVKYSGCYKFSTNQFIKSNSDIWKSCSLDDKTIAFWMCPDTINCGGAGGFMHEAITVSNFTMFNTVWQFTDGTKWINYSNGGNTVGVWGHYACTFKNSVVKIYKNGKLISTNTNTSILTAPYSQHFVALGCDFPGGDEYFNGKLSDFRIYATALSDKDIEELYETKFSLDPDGNFYCGELSEQGNAIQFIEKSILSVNEFCEFDSINLSYVDTYEDNPPSLSYTPSTGTNSCLSGYRVHQQSLKTGDIVAIDLDLYWDGFDTSNTGGTFSLRFQGYAIKENDGTHYWVSDQYGSALNAFKNLTSLVLSAPSGIFHYSVVVQITSDMLNYIYKMIGLRSDYSNGKGIISIKNLFARKVSFKDDGVNKMKSNKSGDISCTNLIEI